MIKRILLLIGTVTLSVLFVLCTVKIYRMYTDDRKSAESFESIAELVIDVSSETVTITVENEVSETYHFTEPKKITPYKKYEAVYEQNNDFVGWITIDGTNINYPVMQTKDTPNFYINHGFDKAYNDYGVPYVQEDCELGNSDNVIIYGHNMKDGTMFSDLEKYADESFFSEHRYICFDTLADYGKYEIFAVFRTTAYSDDGFKYYNFVDADDAEDFNNFIEKCKQLSLYNTGVTAEYGDKLLTLSTCEYTRTNGRFVVVAKLVNGYG